MAGRLPWLSTGTLTVAASPLVSPWMQFSDDMSQVVPIFSFTGGTSTHTLEGSWDGLTIDTSLTYAAVTVSGTAVAVQHPYVRWRTVQTVGTATVANVFLRQKA